MNTLKRHFQASFKPLEPASKIFVSQTLAQSDKAEANLPSLLRFVRNAALILFVSYVLNRLIWFIVTTSARARIYGPSKLFVGVLHMFPPTYTPTAWDTPTLIWGYFLTIIFVTIFYLAVRWLKSRVQW